MGCPSGSRGKIEAVRHFPQNRSSASEGTVYRIASGFSPAAERFGILLSSVLAIHNKNMTKAPFKDRYTGCLITSFIDKKAFPANDALYGHLWTQDLARILFMSPALQGRKTALFKRRAPVSEIIGRATTISVLGSSAFISFIKVKFTSTVDTIKFLFECKQTRLCNHAKDTENKSYEPFRWSLNAVIST